MEDLQLQELFFQKVKSLIPPTTSLVDELSELLDLSNDSVYRRLRNETPLTINEIAAICKHYRISFDMDSPGTADTVCFFYGKLRNIQDFEGYLSRILHDLKEIKKAPHHKITYAAIDVPIFHHFNYPELAAFKIFYWLKGVMNDQSLNGEKFDISLIDPRVIDLCHEVNTYYTQLPAVEIWTHETIIGHLEQILFYWESGLFKTKEDALRICDFTRQEMVSLQKKAELGTKAENLEQENNYMLYHSEIEIGNNTIIVEKGENKAVYLSFHTLNSMVTTQPQFCNHTQHWIDNLIKKSALISGVSEKQRYQFFKVNFDKIDALENKIKNG